MNGSGRFEVKLQPLDCSSGLGRMSIDKQFTGTLDASSDGEMLSWHGEKNGTAAYVALERVTGTLDGRAGGFVLMHQGLMNAGASSLTVTIVPGSGTGDLEGITGSVTITIEGGEHSYSIEYDLPAA